MRADITWYDLLGALPDASSKDIRQAYDAKAALLRPELLSSAPSTVVTAAARAHGIIDAARRVLGDPVSRQRYDEAAGLWGSGGGLNQPGDAAAGSGLAGSDFAADNPGTEVLRSLGALNLWLARHRDHQRRIPVPDVGGLFYDVFVGVVGKLDLEITFVQLTEHPMLVEGLVVGQSPGPSAKMHRRGVLTVQVWHPPAQATEDRPGAPSTGPPGLT
jgi:curved DNA-binding protein CbpA